MVDDRWLVPAKCRAATAAGPTVLVVAALAGWLGGCASVRSAPAAVELVSLTLLESSPSAQRYRVRLLITNADAAPITVSRVSFRVRLGGQGYLRGESTTPLEVPAGGRETLGVDVSSEVVSSLSQLLALVQGPEHTLPYEIGGELYLAKRRGVPYSFQASGRVPLAMTQ